ncbi:hypothetical protein [Buttiauxella brennerae]|uniref:hypothetical protein n=1 Tax=Buttiauxella brennerae TaxID=82988 RepID=UPI00286ECF71|nr:hypothetical protein [Buttiauxella brennerae]
MSWPVQMILPRDGVLKIRWKRWFFSFLCILFTALMVGVVLKTAAPAEGHDILKSLSSLLLVVIPIFLICFTMRVYFYGVCLAAFEAYELESALLKKEWTEWASLKFFVCAYKLLIPSGISQSDIALSKSVEIYNGQQLQLRGHQGETYTEEQLIDELLASVRAKLIVLAKICVFDVMFTYGSSNITFNTFKECWVAIGLPEKCLNKYYCLDGTVEQEFDRLSGAKNNQVSIIISANAESVEKYSAELTEFASILLVTHQEELPGNTNNGVALRGMTCGKSSAKQHFIHMMTYQPDVLKTSRVFFSNMSVDEVLDISDVLRTTCLSMNIEWEFEIQHLNLVLGQLGNQHFWMVFPLSLFVSEKTKESVLMIASVGNDYVFNVVKPFGNGREQ